MTLTPHRDSVAPHVRDTGDVAAGVQRLVRAIGRRVAQADPWDLPELMRIEQELASAWSTAVEGLRASGFSDGEIGRAIGVSRQAVAQRWPRRNRG